MRGVQGPCGLDNYVRKGRVVPLDDSLERQSNARVHAYVPRFSLLRASTGQRLVLVAVMLAVLWLAVIWALQ